MRLTLLFLLTSALSFGQVIYSSNTKADVDFIISSVKLNNNEISEELRMRFPINKIGGKEYVSFLAVASPGYSKETLLENNVLVGARIGDIVSIKYPLSQLNEIFQQSNFKSIQLAAKVKPLLDKVVGATRADSVWMGYGLPEGYTGKDVIIGITDWGFDYTSPMFYDTLLSNTRILAAWDQFKTSGPAPLGYGYGTVYDTPTDLLNAESDTSNIYSYHTHGNHVAGIAGGSGAGTAYRGIGFESNFLFTTFLVDESAVLDAWEWMYSKANAAGKRLVINMSWGLYHMDAIDGTSLLSQALDMYSNMGVVFATSAGNNGNVNFHIDKTFAADTLKSKIDFYANAGLPTVWGQSIHMWGEPGYEFSSGIRVLNASNQLVGESLLYSTATTTSYVDSFVIANGIDTVWFNLSADAIYPTNGRPQIRLRVKFPPTGYKVVLVSTAPVGKVHYWNVTELTNDVGNWGMPFSSLGAGYTSGNDSYGIGTPACSNSAISVAAYSSEYYTPLGTLVGGAVASFSSVGPLMTDSLKPDITAPGVSVGSSISSFTDASFTQIASVDFNGRTYPFARFSGTSMSSPATTGVITLILDANPYLSAQQVKEIIIACAREDANTGIIPATGHTKWGWGKLNAYAAVQMALITTGLTENKKEIHWSVYPNPTHDQLTLAGIEGEIQSVQLIDQFGRNIPVSMNDFTIDVQSLEGGTYFLRLLRENKVEQVKFVKQ